MDWHTHYNRPDPILLVLWLLFWCLYFAIFERYSCSLVSSHERARGSDGNDLFSHSDWVSHREPNRGDDFET